MAKYKVGDKIVLEIKGVDIYGSTETHYAFGPGSRLRIDAVDELAEPYKEPKPAKKAAKKAASKK